MVSVARHGYRYRLVDARGITLRGSQVVGVHERGSMPRWRALLVVCFVIALLGSGVARAHTVALREMAGLYDRPLDYLPLRASLRLD